MVELITLQMRVLYTLILRETRATFGTSSLGYLWAIITPAISVGVLVFIFSLIGRAAPFGTSLAVFFATGVLTLEFFNKLSTTLMTSFGANKTLLTYPLIKEVDTLYARLILITATYAIIMTVAYGAMIYLEIGHGPWNMTTLLQAFFATAFLGFSMGTLNAVIVSMLPSWQHIEKIITRPLMFISGVFYVPSRLPSEAQDILYWNPVIHLVEWKREAFYGNYNSQIFDMKYPLILSVFLLFVGLGAERLTKKKRALV